MSNSILLRYNSANLCRTRGGRPLERFQFDIGRLKRSLWHVADVDRPTPTLDATLKLFRLYHRRTPIERNGFMVLARIYVQLDDSAAGKLILRAGELTGRMAVRPF